MSDRTLTNEERAELARRKLEISVEKKAKKSTTLDSFKAELGLPKKGNKK